MLGPRAASAPSSASPSAAPASFDREVATWVLARHGQIDVEDHHPPRITRLDQLPSGPFTIKAITLLRIRSVRDEGRPGSSSA